MDRARPWSGRRLHFVGIGGAGMSGLALVANALGAQVTGSDRAESEYLVALRAEGVRPRIGHDASQLPADAQIVYSTAVGPENPERALARARGQRELHRADLLGELTRLRPAIAVTGTHGKTTTSAMIAHALALSGADPAYLVGGELRLPEPGAALLGAPRNAGWGTGWLVVEADESDRSMLRLQPRIAVLTNVELDHHATYGSRLELERAFRAFLALAEQAVVWDRPELLALRDGPVVAFEARDAALDEHGSRLRWRGHELRLRVPGLHNARNAVAALEACRLAGAGEAACVAALASFAGAGRRFEPVGRTRAGALVYDDYAHHPTEVAATLAAARTLRPRRLVAVFQPHLFSRTRHLARAFGAALAGADLVAVLDVYPAREDRAAFPGVSGRLVAEAVCDAAPGRRVAWLPGFDEAERFLGAELRPGDLCLTLGAGNVWRLGRRLVGAGEPAAAA